MRSECLSNSICVNIEGNYTCPCNNGFAGDGFTGCESKSCYLSLNWDDSFYTTLDINECEDGTHNCDRNAVCTDNVGSFALHLCVWLHWDRRAMRWVWPCGGQAQHVPELPLQTALMDRCGWWMEVSPVKVGEREELRSATTTPMAVCVTTSSMRMLQPLSAMELVSYYTGKNYLLVDNICIVH